VIVIDSSKQTTGITMHKDTTQIMIWSLIDRGLIGA
jgi:hypothetical protein